MAGRPTKYTPEVGKLIIDALAEGATRKAAAGAAGIEYQTLLNWLKKGETSRNGLFDFFVSLTRAEAEAENKFARVIFKAAETDWRAAECWLKRRRRIEWGDSIDIRKFDDDTLLRLLAAEEGSGEERPADTDEANG